METWAHGISILSCWKDEVKELNVLGLRMGSSETPEIPRDPHQAALQGAANLDLQFIPEIPPKTPSQSTGSGSCTGIFHSLCSKDSGRCSEYERGLGEAGMLQPEHGAVLTQMMLPVINEPTQPPLRRYVTTRQRSQMKHPEIPRKRRFLSPSMIQDVKFCPAKASPEPGSAWTNYLHLPGFASLQREASSPFLHPRVYFINESNSRRMTSRFK